MIEQALDGIYLESSHDTTAIRNHIERSRYGIHLMYTDRMKISDNSGTMNYTGAMIMVVKDSEVTGNLFRMQQENVNAQGILLYDTHETLVQDNVMDGNRIGLLVQQSTDNDFRHNQISRNFVGMQIHRSEQNTITRNVFLGNVLDAQADQSTKNDIIYNYWEAFRGIDTDSDGISNLDYAIHPFSYRLFQKQPAFQLLFQSPSMALLERMFQLGQEQWMKDVAPLMAPPFPIKATAIASSGQFMIWFGIGGLSFVIILLIWARRRIV